MKQKVYLDTSIPSRYYDDERPEDRRITRLWWKNELPAFEAVIFEVTSKELEATPDEEKQKRLLVLVKDIPVVKVTNEAEALSKKYMGANVIPDEYEDDALHIAVATVNNVDVLISWNFRHLVNEETRTKVNAINLLNGYREIKIDSPLELGGGKYSNNIGWFAKKFELPEKEVIKVAKEVKKEFPKDKMMYELHLIRALSHREREIKKLSFAEMQKLRRKRMQKGLAKVGYKLVSTGRGTSKMVKIK